MKKLILTLSFFISCNVSFAGETTGLFKVTRVMQWGNGDVKIFTDKTTVNGLEGCTATDKSLAIKGTSPVVKQVLSMALTARVTDSDMASWVQGCCVTHSGNQYTLYIYSQPLLII